jgi:hypothetical protein
VDLFLAESAFLNDLFFILRSLFTNVQYKLIYFFVNLRFKTSKNPSECTILSRGTYLLIARSTAFGVFAENENVPLRFVRIANRGIYRPPNITEAIT